MSARWGVTEWRNRSLSRHEEHRGWVGRVQTTGAEDPPARAFRDDPTPAEIARDGPRPGEGGMTDSRDRHRNALDHCPDCGGPKLKRAKRCKSCANKARRGVWRTVAPTDSAGRYRARQVRPVQGCEFPDCDAVGTDRHHIDENTANNDPSNIAVYCRRHHMLVDGRLKAAAERAPLIRRFGAQWKEAA